MMSSVLCFAKYSIAHLSDIESSFLYIPVAIILIFLYYAPNRSVKKFVNPS